MILCAWCGSTPAHHDRCEKDQARTWNPLTGLWETATCSCECQEMLW